MTDAERHETARTWGRAEQLLDQVGELLAELRSLVREEQEGETGGGAAAEGR